MESINSPEWAKPKIDLIFREVQKSNGKVKNIMFGEELIKIMSKVSNYIRYDVISKNDNSTFKLPAPLELDLDTFLI